MLVIQHGALHVDVQRNFSFLQQVLENVGVDNPLGVRVQDVGRVGVGSIQQKLHMGLAFRFYLFGKIGFKHHHLFDFAFAESRFDFGIRFQVAVQNKIVRREQLAGDFASYNIL